MKLSKAQLEVLSHMRKGLFLWTNEGSGYNAWLGGDDARKVKTVNIRTAQFLNNNNLIKFVDGDYRYGLFKYELAE